MKKLMILGGSRYILPVIEAAHKLNLYVITCDYIPDNIAHKYSDEYRNVSIIDKEAVLKVAKELEIDGIMSFACDPGVVTAAYVAEKMGLPSCGSYESVTILQNKGLFRKFLTENNFNVPKAKSYTDVSQALSDVDYYQWPVIVKPTDSAGSKGVTRVDDVEKIKDSIKYALSFSHSDEFIIEEFIEKNGYSSDSDGFSVEGKLEFVSFSSQRFDESAENPYTPSAYSWPSSISDKNQKELKSEIQRLLKLLNMKTSIYNIETREDKNGKAFIMEVSPRGGGNRLAEMLKFATGIDLVTNSVRAAVGLPVEGVVQNDYNGYWAEIILHSSQNGKFSELIVDDSIKEYIKQIDLWVEKGDEVHTFTAANYAIGTLVLCFDDEHQMNVIVENIYDYIKVKVEK